MTGIRQLYNPIQPTVQQKGDYVTYREFLPDPALQPFIYCYWELKTSADLKETFHYRVVADGCIDIFFELDNPQNNFVMGFCNKFTEFALQNAFHYIGIRFLPTMFPQLFSVNASELSNHFEHLKHVLPAAATEIENNFAPGQSISAVREALDKILLASLAKASINNDSRLYDSINLILEHSGMINIETDLNTGISSRQLRRLFQYYVGDTAKTFCKVVRFQNILRAKPSTQSLRENKLFFHSGYYDQAHFIKEFRNFYGVSPSRAFEK